ncbi:MAG: hypothetical protein ACK481_00645 [Candidatus Melainabacteria bacterium]|jgi:hypothetical protein
MVSFGSVNNADLSYNRETVGLGYSSPFNTNIEKVQTNTANFNTGE